MKKRKKSQITIYIIIGIAIVFFIGISLYFKLNYNPLRDSIVDSSVEPVYSFTEECIKETGKRAIIAEGLVGGNIRAEKKTEFGIPYYFYEGSSYIPEKEDIEYEISELIDEYIFDCIGNYSDFSEYDVRTNFNMSSKAKIEKDRVIISAKFPLTISKENKSYSYEDFSEIILPIRLGLIYDTAYNLTKEQMFYPQGLCITCIQDKIYKNALLISTHDYSPDTVIITISDNRSKIGKDNYVFIYANKYSIQNQKNEL